MKRPTFIDYEIAGVDQQIRESEGSVLTVHFSTVTPPVSLSGGRRDVRIVADLLEDLMEFSQLDPEEIVLRIKHARGEEGQDEHI